MITSIQVSDTASFGDEPAKLEDLGDFNVVFGSNGTGKTTISRIIADPSHSATCQVTWAGPEPLQCLVYNRDFINRNFDESDELKGIFTLGEEHIDTRERIEAARAAVADLGETIQGLRVIVQGEGGKRAEIDALEERLKTRCWNQKQEYDDRFAGAFSGYRNSQERFLEKVLTEENLVGTAARPLHDLEEDAETVFGPPPSEASLLEVPDFSTLLAHEENPVLQKAVVGTSDVDIADMIERLGNSDWVQRGRQYFDVNDGDCPFCQQKAPVRFEESLRQYFDATFESDKNAIDDLLRDYQADAKVVTQVVEGLTNTDRKFLDVDRLGSASEVLQSGISENLSSIRAKEGEPSRRITLASIAEVAERVQQLALAANDKIAAHNKTVANLSSEKERLTREVWRYVLDEELRQDLKDYHTDRAGLENAITSLTGQIEKAESDRANKLDEIRELERRVTSVRPTVDAINQILGSFGFRGFTLQTVGDETAYRLVRTDGSDAKETLSEGEKTFVTFLYFFYRLRGSESESDTARDRVVVFDDPVSSLDSDILFVVSTLIKRLCTELAEGRGHIKQVFILTHNVYFHRQVTLKYEQRKGRFTFWILRKDEYGSWISGYARNPIRSSYELLWSELTDEKRSNLAVQNAMRRILENYFGLLGGLSFYDIAEEFDGNDQRICNSLIAWMHAGSHGADEDVFISVDDTTIDAYLRVFKGIFEKCDQLPHYEMMMGRAS